MYLKQKVPDVLPESGVTSVFFKVWWNQVMAYVAEDLHSAKFMKDGLYNKWEPECDCHRIQSLHNDDLELRALHEELDSESRHPQHHVHACDSVYDLVHLNVA